MSCILFTRPDGTLNFRRSGNQIETPGINYSGKITVLHELGRYQIWRKASGSCWAGTAIKPNLSPTWYALMEIRGPNIAFPLEVDEPKRRAVAYRNHLLAEMQKLHNLETTLCSGTEAEVGKALETE